MLSTAPELSSRRRTFQASLSVCSRLLYEHPTNAAGQFDNMAWADANFNGTDVGKDNAGPTVRGNWPAYRWDQDHLYHNLPTQDESAGLIGQPEPLAAAEGGSGRTAAYRGNRHPVDRLDLHQGLRAYREGARR